MRGWTDRIIMAVNDALLAFPGILLALAVMIVVGANKFGIVLALGLAYIPSVVRVVRGTVLSIREKEYIEASRVIGNSELYSMAAPRAAEQPRAGRRAGDQHVRLGAAGGKRAQLPRPRRAAAGADLGQHAGGEPALHGDRGLAQHRARACASR